MEKSIKFIVEKKKGDDVERKELEIKNYSGWVIGVGLMILSVILFKDETIKIWIQISEWIFYS